MLLSNNFDQILGGRLRFNSLSENYCKKQILADGNNKPIVARAHYCPGIFRQPIYFVIKKGKIRQLDTQIDAFYELWDGENWKENGLNNFIFLQKQNICRKSMQNERIVSDKHLPIFRSVARKW